MVGATNRHRLRRTGGLRRERLGCTDPTRPFLDGLIVYRPPDWQRSRTCILHLIRRRNMTTYSTDFRSTNRFPAFLGPTTEEKGAEFPREGEVPSEPATRRAVVDPATGRVNRPGHTSAYRRSDDPAPFGPAAEPAGGSDGGIAAIGRDHRDARTRRVVFRCPGASPVLGPRPISGLMFRLARRRASCGLGNRPQPW